MPQQACKHLGNQLPLPFRHDAQTLVAQQGLALSQVMQSTQLRLSTSCAGWE